MPTGEPVIFALDFKSDLLSGEIGVNPGEHPKNKMTVKNKIGRTGEKRYFIENTPMK